MDPSDWGMYVPLRKFLPPLCNTLAPGNHTRRYINGLQAQPFVEEFDQSLRPQQQRYMVHRGHVVDSNDLLGLDMTKHGNLVLGSGCQRCRSQQPTGDLYEQFRGLVRLIRKHLRYQEAGQVLSEHEQSFAWALSFVPHAYRAQVKRG